MVRMVNLSFVFVFLSSCGNPFGAFSNLFDPPSLLPESDIIVIGQKDFNSQNENGGVPGRATAYYSDIIGTDGTNLILPDDCRVRVFPNSNLASTPIVVGQSDLSSNTCISAWGGTISAASHGWGGQSTSDGTRLIVADPDSNRILIYNSIPTTDGAAADVVLGQLNFTTGACNQGLTGPTAQTLCYPAGVAIVGTKLVVSDWSNNRLLIYNTIPTTNGAAADVVIGQADFISKLANRGGVASASTLNGPWGVSTDGTKLAVADYSNNRIMIWNTVPIVTSTPANVIVGQPDGVTTSAGTTAEKLKTPSHAIFTAGSLYVADYQNHRVLYFALVPVATGASATAAIGQSNLTSGSSNRGGATAANSFSYPIGLAAVGGTLFISDSSNNRILKFNAYPTADTPADEVLGQVNFTSNYPRAAGPENKGFTQLAGVASSDQYVIVSDQGSARALIFDKKNPEAGAIAVLGKPDFATTCYPTCPARSASSFAPMSAAVDSAQRLYIADSGGSRILVFNQIPTVSGAAADFVLGQDDFTTTAGNSGLDKAGQFASPQGVWAHADKLYVADTYNHRILVFQLPITQNRQLPLFAIGQPDLVTQSAGTTSLKMSYPSAVYTDGSTLLITSWFSYVKIYSTLPSAAGAVADNVLGAVDHITPPAGGAMAANNFQSYIVGSSVIDNFIFVSDKNNARILGFDMTLLANGMNATKLIGQTSFTNSLYSPLGTPDGKSLGHLSSPVAIVPDADGKYVWIADRWAYRVIRIKKSAFWNYVN